MCYAVCIVGGELHVTGKVHLRVTLYHTHLATSEYEESAGLIGKVDLRVALHNREFAISTTIYSHGAAIYIFTCCVQNISGNHVFKYFRVYERFVDVDDDISFDMSAGIASAIDIGIHISGACQCVIVVCFDNLPFQGVKYKFTAFHEKVVVHIGEHQFSWLEVSIHIQTNLHVVHAIVWLARLQQSTMVFGIVCAFLYAGIVTSAHHLLIDDDVTRHIDGTHAAVGHTTLVAAIVKRTDVGLVDFLIPLQARSGIYSHTTQIIFHTLLRHEVDAAEAAVGILLEHLFRYHIGTVTAEEHTIDDGMLTDAQSRIGIDAKTFFVSQCRTVTAAIDFACYYERVVMLVSRDVYQRVFYMGTMLVERLQRGASFRYVVVEVGILGMLLYPTFLVCIGIRTVTSTIDIDCATTMKFDIRSMVYNSRDVVTAIYIIKVASSDQYTR